VLVSLVQCSLCAVVYFPKAGEFYIYIQIHILFLLFSGFASINHPARHFFWFVHLVNDTWLYAGPFFHMRVMQSAE